MKRLKLTLAALALSSSAIWAQTDVTDTYLTNADFSSVEGWTEYVSGSFRDYGNGLIGTYNVRFSPATVDETHLATEYCFGFEARWSPNYASFNQETKSELPEGVYKLTYDVENVNGATRNLAYNNLFYVQVGDTKYADESTEWMKGKSSWTTHTISFTITAASKATVSLGYGTGTNNVSADVTPALYVSHLKLTWTDLAAGARLAWQEALQNANAAKANADYACVTGEELTALNAEIAKSEPTTVDGYNEAAEALKSATSAFIAAKVSYDALEAAKATEVPELAYAAAAKKTALTEALAVTATSAADAATKTAAITTALRAYYESHALAEGVEGAVNMTDRIANANDPKNNNDWTWTGNKNNPASNEPWTDADGTNTHSYFDGGNWNGSSWTTTMQQTIKVPAGKYLLTAKARSAVNVTFTMAVGEASVNLPHVGSAGNVFDRGWNDASVEFETDGSDAEILVTASSETIHEWFSISDFRLVRLQLYTEMAKAEDYAALNEALTAAKAKTLGFEAGEYAPYNNIEVIKAIATADALDQSAENAKADVTALTEQLTNGWTANETALNAIYDGQFANTAANATSGDIVLPGWTKVNGIRLLVKDEATDPGLAYTDGKAAVFSWGGTTLTYGEQTGYTLPMGKYQMYELTLKVAAWRDGDWPNVLTVGLDGATQTINPNVAGKVNDAEGNPFASVKFYLTPKEDNSVLTIYANRHFVIADLQLVKAVAQDIELSEDADYTPTETFANVTLKRTIKEGFNTVTLPFDLTAEQVESVFGTGAQVYEYSETADGDKSTIAFNSKAENTIAAGVPYLVKATAAASEKTIANVITMSDAAKSVTGTNFDFVGTYAASTDVAAGDYFIGNGAVYRSTGATTIAAFRAYIKAKSAEAQARVIIDGQEATAIEALTRTAENGKVYNLNGQLISQPAKGIFVRDGKKVVVK